MHQTILANTCNNWIYEISKDLTLKYIIGEGWTMLKNKMFFDDMAGNIHTYKRHVPSYIFFGPAEN